MYPTRPLLLVTALAGLVSAAVAARPVAQDAAQASNGEAARASQVTHVTLPGGAQVRSTEAQVDGLRTLAVPGSEALVQVWTETTADGTTTPWYAISLDGQSLTRSRPTSYRIAMATVGFDPLAGLPDYSDSAFSWDGEVHLVQFHTQVLAEYRAALEELGARVYDHLVNHTLIVRMTPEVRSAVEALEVVRWVGPFHPELRLEPGISEALAADSLADDQIYNVAVFERGPEQKGLVSARIEAMGGTTRGVFPEGFRFQAELTPALVQAVIGMPEVASLDRWAPGGPDMNIARDFSGANYLESQTGLTGQGVRGEIFDTGIQTSHPDFQHDGGVLVHGQLTSDSHGTSVAGICFGDGTGNAAARGLMPNGKIVFGYSIPFLNNGSGNRYTHTAQLIDPAQPYQCVFQTNSTGSNRTFFYNSISAELDDILFINDIVILQSQSNAGNQDSRPEAWAKNMVSVGGVRHEDTLTKSDDNWSFGGSIGPASDGRIKPDLAHFYDDTLTCTTGSGYTNFGGTSGATPINAGHFGLFFQMWHNNVWNNGSTGSTVFESRPSARLARAAMINTAQQWTFSGTGHDLTRTHQGWGASDVAKLYDTRNATFWIDEDEPIDNLGTRSYQLTVEPGTPEVKFTMVYRDPKAVNFSGVHRINDLSLRVTSPGGTVYWGNNGMKANMWTVAGGAENSLDVVENVFVQNPPAGSWLVEVLGSDINTDVVPGVPGNNADFALWATGVSTDPCPSPLVYCTPKFTSSFTAPSIGWTGTTSQAANDLVITLTDALPNKNGIVFYGDQQAATPFQGGTLCAGGTITRSPLVITDPQGAATYAETITSAMIGTTRFYQWWFRDQLDPFGTGLSDALQVYFCP